MDRYFQRKHYVKLANLMGQIEDRFSRDVATAKLVAMLKEDNDAFDDNTFWEHVAAEANRRGF